MLRCGCGRRRSRFRRARWFFAGGGGGGGGRRRRRWLFASRGGGCGLVTDATLGIFAAPHHFAAELLALFFAALCTQRTTVGFGNTTRDVIFF